MCIRDSPSRLLNVISSLYHGISIIDFTDLRFSKTFEKLKLKQSSNSISPIAVANDKVIKIRSGLFAETSIDYFLPNTVKNPDYFSSSANIGYRQKVSHSFYVTGQAGIVYPYSKDVYKRQAFTQCIPKRIECLDSPIAGIGKWQKNK